MPSTYGTRSRDRPLGITVLCILGFVGAALSAIKSLGLMARPGPGPMLGLLVLALTAGQVIVLVGLLNLRQWAYKWALLFYGLSALIDLLAFNPLSLLFDVLIVVYLLSKADRFR